MMNVLEHKHPLKLIDLQLKHPKVEDLEDSNDEEEKDLITQDEIVCPCRRCNQDISIYNNYYYKCINDSCNYSLHKYCAELPTTLKLADHPYPLFLHLNCWEFQCSQCERIHRSDDLCYYNPASFNSYNIDVSCAVELEKKRIQHPSHLHPLVTLITKPILSECRACGNEHKGVFFQCTTCSDFVIHNDCATLPRCLLIQNATNNIFHHTHPLTLAYSFPSNERREKYDPKCRVCGHMFGYTQSWFYKCERCIYYVHLDCATSRRESFMSILSIGKGPTTKNFKDADYPNLLCLPFPDQTYNLPKHLVYNEIGSATYINDKVSLHQINHQHELVLVDTECVDVFGSTSTKTNSLIKCHNPLKKIQLLCNVCFRPIIEMPFYKCVAYEDEGCNFTLHEWCTRLPSKVENHPGHKKHTLVLMSKVPHVFLNVFRCLVCSLPCNGYAYGCVGCEYYVDVTCGLMPEYISHKSHPNHILRVEYVPQRCGSYHCVMCLDGPDSDRFHQKGHWVFSCRFCDAYIHPECALLLPETVTHAYDKHPMHLSYQPIENHKSEYFCEICEYELNPHACFYHCDECVQSVHSSCAPLILRSETETYSENWSRGYNRVNIYKFLNVKFGSIHKIIRAHPHQLLFVQGIESDGGCNICHKELQYNMIFKCVKCEFAIDYKCCESLNKS